jgi:NADH-quinone oxidoreductase subunit J
MIHTVLFYLLAAFTLLSAYFVITPRHLFRCAMGLIATLLGVAGLYLVIDAQFLSAVQVTVYVGGILVLIVFVILLVADVTQKVFRQGVAWRRAVAGVVSALMFVGVVLATRSFPFPAAAGDGATSASVEEIGRALLSAGSEGFALAFEVVSLVLIAALIGAITIARAEDKADGSPEHSL